MAQPNCFRCTDALQRCTRLVASKTSRNTRTSYASGLRNAGGAESCALGVEGGVGAGGVVATFADKVISVSLGEDGVGKTATKKEGKAVSPSAAGAGDTTAAADEVVADDTTAASDATVASTVAAAVAATATAAVAVAVAAAVASAVAATTTCSFHFFSVCRRRAQCRR